MKYIILVIGIVILGLSVWGYVDDKTYEYKCGNPKPSASQGFHDCVPPVTNLITGERASVYGKIFDFSELIESNWLWGMVTGLILVIFGVVATLKGFHPKMKTNLQ